MKSKFAALLIASSTFALLAPAAHAQVAGTQPLGITVQESTAILAGWSVKKSILNKPVYNENNERVFERSPEWLLSQSREPRRGILEFLREQTGL